MTTLITGGTGFIGGTVIRTLLGKGERDLVVFDVRPFTQRMNDVAGGVELVQGDLGNFSHVLNA